MICLFCVVEVWDTCQQFRVDMWRSLISRNSRQFRDSRHLTCTSKGSSSSDIFRNRFVLTGFCSLWYIGIHVKGDRSSSMSFLPGSKASPTDLGADQAYRAQYVHPYHQNMRFCSFPCPLMEHRSSQEVSWRTSFCPAGWPHETKELYSRVVLHTLGPFLTTLH